MYGMIFADVNECDTSNGGCEHNCHNYIGSYYCTCRDGYDLDPDYHGCTGYYWMMNIHVHTYLNIHMQVT